MLLVNSVWILLLLPFVIAILHLTVIRKEERYLSATFGLGYDEYRHRARPQTKKGPAPRCPGMPVLWCVLFWVTVRR
jgi:hypothetical protein